MPARAAWFMCVASACTTAGYPDVETLHFRAGTFAMAENINI